jgi:hypothetical protein
MKNVSATLFLCAALAFAGPALAQRAVQPTPPPPDQSLHVYRETPDGGAEIVVNHELSRKQVQVLREQLRAEAKAYEQGEYVLPSTASPPASLARLRAGASHISVSYDDVDGGGAIHLKTSDQALVRAIYDYFAAQVGAERRAHPLGGPGDV